MEAAESKTKSGYRFSQLISRHVMILATLMKGCTLIDAKLNIIPHDTEVRINDSTYFNCSTSLSATKVQWRHGNFYVYTGVAILEPYNDGRFLVEINASTGASNLVFRSVQPSDAGAYECVEDEGFGEKKAAWLIIIDGDPVCKSMHLHGVIGPNSCGIEPEEVRLSCSIKYHGNSIPVLQWKASDDNQSISDGRINITSINNEVTYMLTMKSSLTLNNASFICQTARTSDKRYSCSHSTIQILYVFDSNVTINMTMNDEVSCFANTSQLCSYKWKWFSGDDSTTESADHVLKPKRVGWHRCEATCSFGGTACIVNPLYANVYSDEAKNGQIRMMFVLLLVPAFAVIGLITYCWRKKQDPTRNTDEIALQPAKQQDLDENIALRAIHDFDPEQMSSRDKREVTIISERRRDSKQKNHETALTLKTGDKMETIPPANIGDTDGWWLVKHLHNGNVGYIPRNCVVIETDHMPSETTLDYLYLYPALLDAILEKSYLLLVLNFSPDQKDGYVIRALASVAFCWFQQITKRRLKSRIWKRLKAVYDRTKRKTAIIRNIRNYFSENIHLNDKMLLHLNCITEEESHQIQRQRSKRNKSDKPFDVMNDKLLYVMKSLDETKFSNFVKCLRQSNQKMIARIFENGGGVIKVQVQYRVVDCTRMYMYIRKLHSNIEAYRNRKASWSYQINNLITELWEEDIEILNSQMDRRTVIVWMWCRSQWAVENLRNLYETNALRKILCDFANIRPSSTEIIQRIFINIDCNQFKKTVAVSLMCINLTDGIGDRSVIGITKLRNEIYVVYTSSENKLSDPRPKEIRVYDGRNPIRLRKKFEEQEIGDIYNIYDIASSEKDNCVYLSDSNGRCIWKMTKETDDEYKIIKWLTLDYDPTTLSVSRNGHLLLTTSNYQYASLMIYGSDAELIQSIKLPSVFGLIYHAVETSIGNIVTLHRLEEEKSGWPDYAISELTSDEQMVLRRFISSDQGQVTGPCHLSLDSDDQVFLADTSNNRVILFDSDLKWNQILCSKEAEEEGCNGSWPMRMCYDEENKHLIVGGYYIRGISVYSLSRK